MHSIYFGGGTPSILTIPQFQKLLNSIKSLYLITEDCEICLEANPGTITPEYIFALKNLGFTRISMGVQSTNPWDLKRLERIHNIENILTNIQTLRKVGFDNVNFDLIYGLPWQDIKSWKNNLDRAIELNPEHLSLYSLIIEEGTAIHDWYQRGLIGLIDQDLEGDMFEYSIERLKQAGYEQYELSNWAKRDSIKDFRCRHNMQYWLNQPYLGFGAGAHGYVNGIRTINTPNGVDYISRMKLNNLGTQKSPLSPAIISSNAVDKRSQMKDHLLLGLRLTRSGVNTEEFFSRYGKSIYDIFESEIGILLNQGLIQWGDGKECLRLSKRGVMVANQVFMHFI